MQFFHWKESIVRLLKCFHRQSFFTLVESFLELLSYRKWLQLFFEVFCCASTTKIFMASVNSLVKIIQFYFDTYFSKFSVAFMKTNVSIWYKDKAKNFAYKYEIKRLILGGRVFRMRPMKSRGFSLGNLDLNE